MKIDLPWIAAGVLVALGAGTLLYRHLHKGKRLPDGRPRVLPQEDSAPRVTTETDPHARSNPTIRLDAHRGESVTTIEEERR